MDGTTEVLTSYNIVPFSGRSNTLQFFAGTPFIASRRVVGTAVVRSVNVALPIPSPYEGGGQEGLEDSRTTLRFTLPL